MRNLDFATTPQVELAIHIEAADAAGAVFFSRGYSSGRYSGKTVMDTLSPGELINRTAHDAMARLLDQAAVDLSAALKAIPTKASAQPAPAVSEAPAPVAVAPAAMPEASPEEKLRRLKSMYEQGLISKETYEAKQREVLSSF